MDGTQTTMSMKRTSKIKPKTESRAVSQAAGEKKFDAELLRYETY